MIFSLLVQRTLSTALATQPHLETTCFCKPTAHPPCYNRSLRYPFPTITMSQAPPPFEVQLASELLHILQRHTGFDEVDAVVLRNLQQSWINHLYDNFTIISKPAPTHSRPAHPPPPPRPPLFGDPTSVDRGLRVRPSQTPFDSNASYSFLSTISDSESLPTFAQDQTATQSSRIPALSRTSSSSTVASQETQELPPVDTQPSSSPERKSKKSKMGSSSKKSSAATAESRSPSPEASQASASTKASPKNRSASPPAKSASQSQPVGITESLVSPKSSRSQKSALKTRTREVPSPTQLTAAGTSIRHVHFQPSDCTSEGINDVSSTPEPSSLRAAKRSFHDVDGEDDEDQITFRDARYTKRSRTNDDDSVSAISSRTTHGSAVVQETRAPVAAKPVHGQIIDPPPSGTTGKIPHFRTVHGCVTASRPSPVRPSNQWDTIRPAPTTSITNTTTAGASTIPGRQQDSFQGSSQMNPSERLEYRRTHHLDGTPRTTEDAPPVSVDQAFNWASYAEEGSEFDELEQNAQNQLVQPDGQEQVQNDHSKDGNDNAF